MKVPSRYPAILLLTLLTVSSAISQQLTINTQRIDMLVKEWNLGHNTRNPQVFQNIYHDQVMMYGKTVSREKASLMKKLTFVRNPDYKHRLSGDMKYTLYKNGIVKCDFTKETWQNGKWESSATYLLIGFRNHAYWIVGESELETDRKLGFRNALGEPVKTEIASTTPENSPTLYAKTSVPEISKTSLASILAVHVYPVLLYGVLPLLALALFVVVIRERLSTRRTVAFAGAPATTVNDVREHKFTSEPKKPEKQVAPTDETVETTVEKKPEPIPTIHPQEAFAKYVVSMFDVKSFSFREFREGESKFALDSGKRSYTKFKIDYRENDLLWSSFDVYPFYKKQVIGTDILFPMIGSAFENRRTQRSDLYFVLGIGGSASQPEEIYLIPGKDFKLVMDKDHLQAFRRSPSDPFRFDSSRKELH